MLSSGPFVSSLLGPTPETSNLPSTWGAAAAGEAAIAARPSVAQSAARARVRNERELVEMSGVVVFMGQASRRGGPAPRHPGGGLRYTPFGDEL